ncbi:MAG TPA: hypothetical protein VJ205_03130 [Gammaproteobacteria bacterium]|nr:hypothetical protein [Gammaproteobacteria bacterium]
MNNNLQTRLIALASNENRLNYKLLMGGFFLIVSTFLTLITGFYPSTFAIEIIASFFAIVMALLCFRHVYLEYLTYSREETHRRVKIINKIMAYYPCHPDKILLERCLQNVLNKEHTLAKRVKKLQTYETDPFALNNFLMDVTKQQDTKIPSLTVSLKNANHQDHYHLNA